MLNLKLEAALYSNFEVSGTETFDGPVVSAAEVAEAVVEAVLTALPELDIGGLEFVASPEFGAGNFC